MFFERVLKTQSELEKRFLEDCVCAGLIVEPQYLIGNIHADFAIPEKKIAIEVDSKQYHSSRESFLNDMKRDEIYKQHKWIVIRLPGPFVFKWGEEIAYEIKNLGENFSLEKWIKLKN